MHQTHNSKSKETPNISSKILLNQNETENTNDDLDDEESEASEEEAKPNEEKMKQLSELFPQLSSEVIAYLILRYVEISDITEKILNRVNDKGLIKEMNDYKAEKQEEKIRKQLENEKNKKKMKEKIIKKHMFVPKDTIVVYIIFAIYI